MGIMISATGKCHGGVDPREINKRIWRGAFEDFRLPIRRLNPELLDNTVPLSAGEGVYSIASVRAATMAKEIMTP
ncbi:MAG: hypothetical protein H7839_05850 [Magnetococcus sp. YQC-5]